jgi:hypothetical protein
MIELAGLSLAVDLAVVAMAVAMVWMACDD